MHKTKEAKLLEDQLREFEERYLDINYEDNPCGPSQPIYDKALALMQAAVVIDKDFMPASNIILNEDGSLYFYWHEGARYIKLAIPCNPREKMFLYHENGDIYDGEWDITADRLVYWINWLNNGEGESNAQTE